MATRIGLEPTTPSVTGWCSNQLSYRAMIAQVHRFWRLTAGTCVIIPEKRAVVKHEFRKMSKKFWKVRHSGKNTKTKRTEYSLCACGRGSKSRTHGTRFWRPLLYQLSYRAMIAQVRAAFTAGTCPIIPEDGRLVKRKKQKSRKKDEKGGLPQSAHCIRSQLLP